MLKLLHIENIAVIERSEIEFQRGFSVLTGETGAGKSIVIDAIGAVLGGRTSRDLVRTGAPSATVTAVFSSEGTEAWCEENGVEPEDGELFLSRRITADGKNTCRINGSPVTVAQLRSLGSELLDIHGQNDGQRLLDERYHRQYLDQFAGTLGEKEAYMEAYEAYSRISRRIQELSMDEAEKERRMDSLRYQIAELEKADLHPGEQEEKQARRELLKNAGKLSGNVNEAFEALYGDMGAVELISAALSAAQSGSRYSETLGTLAGRLGQLRLEAQDIAEELRDLQSEFDFSPMELDELDSRLDQLRRLSRKYGADEQEMLEYLDRCRAELQEIEFADDEILLLKKKEKTALEAAKKAAMALSNARREAAERLEALIAGELKDLAMPGVRFSVDIQSEGELTKEGWDEVRFLMSANRGEALGRISHIASGGELSRIMLAMKKVLSAADPVGTLIFDEIDTGVSGIAAQRVGEKLADLSGGRQVICVTHLPQIAALADHQYRIEKDTDGERTYTRIQYLDKEERVLELARIMGGENVAEATLASAREQLQAAESYKSRKKGD